MEYRVVTICGSMRFYGEMLMHAARLTCEGVIVLMPFVVGETGEVKLMLDALHLKKIDMSHALLVVNPGGYIGLSTSNEIWYASRVGKEIMYAYGKS